MSKYKNVGIVAIPHEYLDDNKITPEDLKGRLVLPKSVKVYKTYEDWYRQTVNFMLISTEPVDETTFPTAPGALVPFATAVFVAGFIVVGSYEPTQKHG